MAANDFSRRSKPGTCKTFDWQGEVIEGSFRELKIVQAKADVVIMTTTSLGHSRLRLIGYRCENGRLVIFPEPDCPTSIYDSDEWLLSYPGIHKETIKVFFKGEYVVKVEYHRDLMAP